MTKRCIVALMLSLAVPCVAQTAHPTTVTPRQADEIVDHLVTSLADYVFPEVAEKLQNQIRTHRSEYRGINDPNALAAKLTEDLRAVGHDHHLAVKVGLELAEFNAPTQAEEEHSHAFDLANGHGMRSARRLPGNIGYLDLAYFSPDSDVGSAFAAAMQLVRGTEP
jgi:peptidase S41-like protein